MQLVLYTQSRSLKPRVKDGRATDKITWVPESLLEGEPAINKETPFNSLREQGINFFFVCPNIHFGVYMFHQLASSNWYSHEHPCM